ncbi:MAG: hypothetical protein R3E50_11520 [Halioglobus sp.]
MKNQAVAAIVAGIVAGGLHLGAVADKRDDGRDDDRGSQYSERHGGARLKVALWGDEFYNDDPSQKALQIDQTIASMNKHDLDFTLFVGDTKNGSSECTDQAIGQEPRDIFNRLNAPTIYSLGDNEWTDCHRITNGSYDPLERLSYLRSQFFNSDKSQGKRPLKLKRQGAYGQAYSENSRYVRNRVEFVALHIPGSNNNLVATAKQCTSKSNRGDIPGACEAATAEYRARNEQNLVWLKESFAEARKRNYAGIVIAIQADVYFPFELSDGIYQDEFLPQLDANNGYTDFFNTLVAETQSFNGKVLLVHGDSHYFKIDKAMYNPDGRLTANFTRLEVFGSEDNSWVEMTVDPSSPNVFSFEQVNLQ